jgi:hypothetical protein
MTNPKIAVEFLEKLRPGGPWVLSAVIPDGAIETITATNVNEVSAFIRANDGKRNLYYGVNATVNFTRKSSASDDEPQPKRQGLFGKW